MNNSSSKWGHLACFVAYAIFGFNIIGCKGLASDGLISPVALFCLRSIGAGLLFWLLSLFIPAEKVRRADYPRIFMASVLGFFLTQITFLMAIHDITPMDCSIVSSLSPIYTMFIAAVAIHEPITLKKAGGVALSFAGIIFLILNSVGSGGPATTTSTAVLLMIANGLCFSLYLGIFKPVIQRYSVVTFMKWIFLFSTAMALPFAGRELVNIDYLSLPSHYVAELAFLIVGATFISYFLIPVGQKRIRPTLVSLYSYVQPIIAILISIALGMDVLSWQKVLATVTVFAGVVIVSYSRSASR
ncbi:MAG: DMT family transporter [Muribaculaceae bacterium]|nr:DMT family transporter [Muribaculaceae bacterium]MDY3933163.1 DMT family transporter [Muribaculaceae bacterium]